jgi:thymidylate synthase (FAD)
MASFSQVSQRHVRICKSINTQVHPPNCKDKEKAAAIFEDAINVAFAAYQALLDEGVHKEDARYILPQAVTTSMIATFDARSLKNVIDQRTAPDAQWEIRELATRMADEVLQVAPLFAILFQAEGVH